MTNSSVASPGQVVGLSVQNAGTAALQSGVTTMGQVFQQGDVPAGQSLVARIGNTTVPVQVDVKTTHSDGSIKMAVLSFERPLLNPGASVNVMLEKAAAPAVQPAVNLAAVSTQHSMTVELTPVGQPKITIDVMDALRDALADGTASIWQKGPLATQARVEVDLPGSMRLKFDVTAFKDGNISVDAMFNNDEAMQATGGRVAYTVKATLDGRVVVQETVNQGQYQNWHREFETSEANGGQGLGDSSRGWLNIRQDIGYLEETGAVAKFDSTIPISESLLQGYAAAADKATWDDPLAPNGVTQAMGSSGGRADIGFTTQSNAVWLMTQDARAAEYSMGQAQAAAGIPWNFYDARNDTWLNTEHYPKLWTDGRGGTGRPGDATSGGLTQQVDSQTGWSTTISHQPDLSYVPYLQTGERWMLDNLQAQTSWTVMSQWPAARFDGEGNLVNLNQVRGAAWSLRQIDNAAWISPDGTKEKAWFQELSTNNWNWLVSKIPEWTATQGEAHGWVPGEYPRGVLPPWQQDYFASTSIAAVARGNQAAETFLDWQTNFLVGRFLQEAKGFAQHDGAAYLIAHADPTTGAIYKTWAQIGDQMDLRNLSNGEGWSKSMGDYAQLALATLAGIHGVTDDPVMRTRIEGIYRELLQEGAPFVDPATFSRDPTYRVTIEQIYDAVFGTTYTPPTTPPPGGGSTPPTSSPPTTPGSPPLVPVVMTLGTGPDTLVLKVSQDFWQGSAQYTVTINGQQIGGVLTAASQFALDQVDTITIKGSWGSTVNVSVRFLNDAWGGTSTADRNLHIEGATLNGRDMNLYAWLTNSDAPFTTTLTKAPATLVLPTPVSALSLDGTTAANTLVGGAGADIIRGLGGNDVMTGGAGRDSFLLGRGANNDRITDFASGADRLFFDGIDPTSLTARLATVNGQSGTMLSYGTAGDSVFLQGVRSLTAGDLVFANVPAATAAAAATQAAAVASPGFAPVSRSFGTGADTLVMRIAQDAWQGSAQYQVFVNGQQFGGTLTASALRANGTHDTLTLKGNWGTASTVEVRFVNDAWGGTAGADRNLYVQGMSLNGVDLKGMAAALTSSGNVLFAATKSVTPQSLSFGTGSDTMVLKLAQDFWGGNAQYTISVNGQQVGGVLTAAAVQANGQTDTITIRGNWGDSVQLSVNLLSDAWGGFRTADRNLHIDSVSLNGVDLGVKSMLGVSGASSFTLAKPVAIPAASFAQIIEGTTAANTLAGGAGADLIRGNAGADVMTGGAGADTFLFGTGAGADRITDFASGADRLFFQGIASASVQATAAAVNGTAGVMITYGSAGDTVFLAGVTQLGAGDLVFA